MDGLLSKSKSKKFRKCKCGAYRLAVIQDDSYIWVAGCHACDTIERLYGLLESGIKIIKDSHKNPDRLKHQCDIAEQEVERLKGEVTRLTLELRRSQHSARAAQAALHRVQKDVLVKKTDDSWN